MRTGVLGLRSELPGDGRKHLIEGTEPICPGSAQWVRDRQRGERLPVPMVVKSLSSDTARAGDLGLHDRGVVRLGYKADLNVIDLERLWPMHPKSHMTCRMAVKFDLAWTAIAEWRNVYGRGTRGYSP